MILRLIFAGFLFVLAVGLSLLFVAIGTPLAVDVLAALHQIRSPTVVVNLPTLTPSAVPVISPVVPLIIPTLQPLVPDSPTVTGNCDPAYPTICIEPMVDDVLSCGDIPQYRKFRVLRPDPQGFDQDGDGVGCEG